MRVSLLVVLVSLSAWAQPSPETQLTMTSLRNGEKQRLIGALGPAEEIPLYRAQLEVDPDKRTVTGKVYVTFPAKKKALTSLLLRVPPNASGKRITLRNAMASGAPTTLEQPEPTLYKVKLEPAVPVGGAAEVELRLDAVIPAAGKDSDNFNSAAVNGGSSSGESDYGAFSAAPEVISLAGLLPVVPPTGADGQPWPGPSGIGDLAEFDPSNFLVSVTVPSAYRVVAPGNQLGEVPQQGGKTQFAYGISGARDFAMFVTKGYEMASKKSGDVTVEAYFLAADSASGKKVLQYAVDSLAEYEKHFSPYPWTTFRVVEARLTGGAGGMEFPGMVSVSTALFRGAADPLAALGMPGLGNNPAMGDLLGDLKPLLEKTLEFTIAHEVAHQWFAIMVGNDPIREPVVDEPLTQHAALLYMEWKHGKKTADVMRDAQLKAAYQVMRMMGGEDAIADRPTNEFESTNEYAAVIYGKAPMLFDALRKQTGDGLYFAALKSYVDSYRWKNASDVGFTTELAKASPGQAKSIEKLRRHWWLEKHGDEDIGQGDLGALFGGARGGQTGQGVQGLDKETQQLLEEAIKALGGGTGF